MGRRLRRPWHDVSRRTAGTRPRGGRPGPRRLCRRRNAILSDIPRQRTGPNRAGVAMDVDVNLGLAVLERTPVVLRVMLAGLPSAWTDATEGDGSWSPYVI